MLFVLEQILYFDSRSAISTADVLSDISIDLTIRNITRITDVVRRRLQISINRKNDYEAFYATCNPVFDNLRVAKTLWRDGNFLEVKS